MSIEGLRTKSWVADNYKGFVKVMKTEEDAEISVECFPKQRLKIVTFVIELSSTND